MRVRLGWKLNAAKANKPQTHIAYIGLGSNIEPEKNLPRAVRALRDRLDVVKVSSAWHSPALGTVGPDFLNAVAAVNTELDVEDLKLQILRPIEADLGRTRGPAKFAPRTIDLDVLVFDERVLDPHVWDYAHLALPMAECNPGLQDKASGKSISELAKALQLKYAIKKVDVLLK